MASVIETITPKRVRKAPRSKEEIAAEKEEKAKRKAEREQTKAIKDVEKAKKIEEKTKKELDRLAKPVLFTPQDLGASSPLDMSHWKDIIAKISPYIHTRLRAHHQLYSLPVFGELWEDLLASAFEDAGLKTSWKPERSHKIGEDMRVIDMENSRISCKSGQFTNDTRLKKPCVKINGSRSESHVTLEDKIRHFSADHDDIYFLLAKEKKFNKKYTLVVFQSSVCKPSLLTWRESLSGKQWDGEGEFSACIGKSMSAQLWTTLPLENCDTIQEFDCN